MGQEKRRSVEGWSSGKGEIQSRLRSEPNLLISFLAYENGRGHSQQSHAQFSIEDIFGMETNRISRPQIMLGSSVQDLDDVKKLAESGTQADAMAVIVKIRAGIAAIKYLNHQNPPNVNGRLTAIVNNVGAQFRASQNAHNAAFPNDPTTIGDFWFE